MKELVRCSACNLGVLLILFHFLSVKHAWERFPEAVEKDFGCRVYGFDPALDYIDHYYTKNILFFNAALDDKDQQAHYNPPAWKHRKFITLIKEMHFDDVRRSFFPATLRKAPPIAQRHPATRVALLSSRVRVNKLGSTDIRL